MMTVDNNKKKKQKEKNKEFELVLALGMVRYFNVVTKLGGQQKRIDRKRKAARSRNQPRSKQAVYHHQSALNDIYVNVLDHAALFASTFKVYFRLCRPRVKKILETLANSGDPYYTATRRFGITGPSLKARVLLPSRTPAYGVAEHTFCPEFSMAPTTASVSCKKFNKAIIKHFHMEFLRLPDEPDLRSITLMHERIHGVIPGMIGSLECMHTYWKNCPVGWQGGSFQGKAKVLTIILEAVADHYLWFWHASYGYSGALNDLNVLNLSPLLRRMTDGSFTRRGVRCGAF
jgi:hypothetical protein